mgnify:CR=1 FL=1
MKAEVTNKFGLPQEVVNAIMKDRYTDTNEKPYDISVSALISPIQQTALAKRYPNDQIVRDVTDYFWAFIGSIGHSVLEEGWHRELGSVIEKRLYYKTQGVVIGGKFDNWGNREIRDYKTTKCYKVQKGDYEDWSKQTNIYAFFCDNNDYPVDTIKIIAMLLDWKEHESYKPNYPSAPIVVIPIEKWSKEEAKEYVEERTRSLLRALQMDDQELAATYPCSMKEMWQDLNDISVLKEGGKRAVRKFETYEEASSWLENNYKEGYYIKKRYSDRKRCMKYCNVANHCLQFKKYCEENGHPYPENNQETIF